MERTINKGAMITLLTGMVLAVFFIAFTVSSYAAVDEEESNDTWQYANSISMGTSIYGSNGSGNNCDYDWFEFTAPINGTVKLSLTNDKYSCNEISSFLYLDPNDDVYLNAYNQSIGATGYIEPGKSGSDKLTVKSGETYYILVKAFKGCDYHFTVGYSIGKTSIKNIYRKNNAFKVSWVKKSKASFYQVRYIKKSVYEDYGWSKAKKIKVGKKYSAVTKKKLANKKTYYVQVRVARTINGNTYYSPWSAKKTVKTK